MREEESGARFLLRPMRYPSDDELLAEFAAADEMPEVWSGDNSK